ASTYSGSRWVEEEPRPSRQGLRYDREVFLEDGEVVAVDLSPLSTSNFFAPGHRIRIEVSGSNFPRFTRNLNTGGDGGAFAGGESVRVDRPTNGMAQRPAAGSLCTGLPM
ncbi:MAG: hypothetical protein HKO98_15225, partial [Gemmatimonadetes bacterium]|nr:hypothetical protein [Gemmatimonadota bacterium]